MSCCGQHRDLIRTQSNASQPRDQHSRASNATGHSALWGGASLDLLGHSSVPIRYREHSRIQVRGPVTGRTYAFSGNQAEVMVDVKDVEILLRTKLFIRATTPRRA